jgi:thiamine-phosphate pyrophosphorylase
MIAYAISDPSTLNFQTLKRDIERLSLHADMVVYRDKHTADYASNSKLFLDEAKRYAFKKILLHGDYKLAHLLNAEGVHLRSTQFSDIKRAKELGLFVVISTHTIEEASEAEYLGANMVTYSPIFTTPQKGKPKGIDELKAVIDSIRIPLIALGGIITKEQIELCKDAGAFGFASIRYFA